MFTLSETANQNLQTYTQNVLLDNYKLMYNVYFLQYYSSELLSDTYITFDILNARKKGVFYKFCFATNHKTISI